MPKIKLGSGEFDVDCEEINAGRLGVSAADCSALAARMRTGEISRVKELYLVRFFSVLFLFCFLAAFPVSSLLNCIDSQGYNNIGDDGAKAIAEALRSNSSVQTLWLVSWFCY